MSTDSVPVAAEAVRESVRAKYAGLAANLLQSGPCCVGCGPTPTASDPVTSSLYVAEEAAAVPEAAL